MPSSGASAAEMAVAPPEPSPLEAAVEAPEDDEPDEDPPQPAAIRASAASESAATTKRESDIDRLLIRWGPVCSGIRAALRPGSTVTSAPPLDVAVAVARAAVVVGVVVATVVLGDSPRMVVM